jgi:hypothetical protein
MPAVFQAKSCQTLRQASLAMAALQRQQKDSKVQTPTRIPFRNINRYRIKTYILPFKKINRDQTNLPTPIQKVQPRPNQTAYSHSKR